MAHARAGARGGGARRGRLRARVGRGATGVGGANGGGSPRGTWAATTTPCPGSETNAPWFDDRSTGYAGCGENAEGRGLFATVDGGRTWTPEPAFDFVEVRSLREEALADPEATGVQVRRVVAFENAFYAAGSVINEPAQVFLPSQLPGATCHLRALELQPPTEDGELLDLHVWSATRALAVGFDHSTRRPLVYLLDGAADDPAAWQAIDLGVPYQAGLNALSVVGDVVVAVGEKIPTTGGGCVLRSANGGRTWEDLTPPAASGPVGPLSAVWLFPDGDILAAGGGGEAWVFTAE